MTHLRENLRIRSESGIKFLILWLSIQFLLVNESEISLISAEDKICLGFT